MKVKTSSLNEKGDTLLFRDTPFTGVAYDVQDDGKIAGCRNVIHGISLGPHRHWGGELPLFDIAEVESILFDEHGDLAAHINGEPFAWVVCEFVDGYLKSEEFIQSGLGGETGLPCTQRYFHYGGAALKQISRIGGKIDSWWENGIPSRIQTTPESSGLRIAYTDDFRVGSLELKLAIDDALHGNIQLNVNGGLHLKGRGIVDELMVCLHGIRNVKQIALTDTELTPRGG